MSLGGPRIQIVKAADAVDFALYPRIVYGYVDGTGFCGPGKGKAEGEADPAVFIYEVAEEEGSYQE